MTAAESVGLTVSAVVLSQLEAGHHGGNQKPDSPDVIARQSQGELQRRLPHIVVCGLGYEASTIEPFVDWKSIAAPF